MEFAKFLNDNSKIKGEKYKLDIYRIKGNRKLDGEVKISGSKNAALPIIVASLLADGETVLNNVPNLVDVRTMLKVIEYIGVTSSFDTQKNIYGL